MSFATAMAMRDMSEKIVSLQGEVDIYKAEVRFRQSLVERLQGEVEALRKRAEQPAAPVPTSFEDWWFKESTLDALEKNLTVEQECRLAWDAAIAAAIPPGCVVVKDEPVARMLTWRGPSHTPTPPRAARTYAEFPEDAALPANKEAYWENAEPLYAARPGEKHEQ